MTRVACQQLAPVLGDLAGNAARAEAAIEEALAAGAEVVVLPELCTSGYMFGSAEEARAAAIGPDDPILARWGELARRHGAVVAGGFCELAEDGTLCNSLALFTGHGDAVPVVYRKLHLWDREKLIFTAGDRLPPVLDTPVGRVSALVCYDLEFPELTRTVALAGTQLLLVPTNWPYFGWPEGERPGEVVIAMATARLNRMAVACADRAGSDSGERWTQGTTIVGADGWVAGARADAGLLVSDIDLDLALDKRLSEFADALADRRPELYGSVVALAESPR